MVDGSVVIVGGTSGIGRALAADYAVEGRSVVITGRSPERTVAVAEEIGEGVTARAFDLSDPETIAPALAGVGAVDHLVLAAIERDENTARQYDLDRAAYLVTLKLIGYTETIHALLPAMSEDSSVVLFGGRAKDRPYPGSTTVTTVNGGIQSMVRSLATELAPIRFNAIHPGIVGDSPYWEGKEAVLEAVVARTPTQRLVTMADVVHATRFLLENKAVNGIDLYVDGGWMLL